MADSVVTSRDPALKAAVIVPSDSTDIPLTKSLWVVGAASGTLTVTMGDGEKVAFPVPNTVGFVLPIRVTRIWATGTTAGVSAVALW